MARLEAYALISSLINLMANLLPEVKNTFFAPSSSSSAQAPDAHAVEADLRRLDGMLQRIKATLYDAEEINIRGKSITLWLKEIRELADEAKYILDEYMYEVYRARVEHRNESKKNLIKGYLNVGAVYSVQIPYDMVDHIRDIKDRFEEITKDREALSLREEPWRIHNERQHTPTSPMVMEKSVFGREEEKEKIIDLLLSKGMAILVLPIVGKGGIGKTTVAQLVYNDKRVQGLFDMIGWVHVSNDFNIERIMRDIIESFTREACDLRNPSVLIEELASIVRGRRFFLVLDDVWNEEPRLWEILRMPLMQATKAAILVTTRNISVANIMQTTEPLQLAYLSIEKCQLLFTHYAFQGLDPVNQAILMGVGMKIVEKCRGLPLVVKSIASLLFHEKELKSWMEILESDWWELYVETDVLAPLQISYERLPTYLKPCLLLCSMFPKDYEYSVNLMTRLWIAHGYIEPKGTKTTEEMAVSYTKMLYERSFFDDYNIKCDDKFGLSYDVTFRLHDIVHDLAWLNSEKTCYSYELNKPSVILQEVRHLHLNKELRELSEFLCSINTPIMQTLVMRFPSCSIYHKMISLSSLLKAKKLRALDLEYPKEVEPFSLENLKHLRYLSLGANFVVSISPQSIFSCYNLRILILDISKCVNMDLEGIGKLINLEFLQLLVSPLKYYELPNSFGMLRNLRVLEIDGGKVPRWEIAFSNCLRFPKVFQLPKCIGNLVKLHKIVIDSLRLGELPESLCKLANLKELILPNCSINKLPEKFGNLTSLRFVLLDELHNFPRSCAKLIQNITMNICSLWMDANNCYGAVGWLNKLNDLKGALMIHNIDNIASIADAKNANLISKCNLETLSLIWDRLEYEMSFYMESPFMRSISRTESLLGSKLPQHYSVKKGILGISIKGSYSKKHKSFDEQNFDILESFQPHPNLKYLEICSYRGLKFPAWMGDPLSCASLVKLWIKSCSHISSLPLSKVLSLKHLYISDCGNISHLKTESLPSQLEHLTIRRCNSLVEIAIWESFTELKLYTCSMLKSLSTVHLKMPKTTSELSYDELENISSLKKIIIMECPNVVIEMNQLVLAEDCEVNIRCCENLKDWCLRHNFKYNSGKQARWENFF